MFLGFFKKIIQKQVIILNLLNVLSKYKSWVKFKTQYLNVFQL